MANYVSSTVRITGEPVVLQEIIDLMDNGKSGEDHDAFCFNNLLRRPAALEGTEAGSKGYQAIELILAALDPHRRYPIEGLEPLNFHSYRRVVQCINGARPSLIHPIGEKDPAEIVGDLSEAAVADLIEIGKRNYNAFRKTGYLNWYDWSKGEWGTAHTASHSELFESDPYSGQISYSLSTIWTLPIKVVEALSMRFPSVKIHYSFAMDFLMYECGFYEFEAGVMTDYAEPVGGTEEWYEYLKTLHEGEPLIAYHAENGSVTIPLYNLDDDACDRPFEYCLELINKCPTTVQGLKDMLNCYDENMCGVPIDCYLRIESSSVFWHFSAAERHIDLTDSLEPVFPSDPNEVILPILDTYQLVAALSKYVDDMVDAGDVRVTVKGDNTLYAQLRNDRNMLMFGMVGADEAAQEFLRRLRAPEGSAVLDDLDSDPKAELPF